MCFRKTQNILPLLLKFLLPSNRYIILNNSIKHGRNTLKQQNIRTTAVTLFNLNTKIKEKTCIFGLKFYILFDFLILFVDSCLTKICFFKFAFNLALYSQYGHLNFGSLPHSYVRCLDKFELCL